MNRNLAVYCVNLRNKVSIYSDIAFAYGQLDNAKSTLKHDLGISEGYIRSVTQEIRKIERRLANYE